MSPDETIRKLLAAALALGQVLALVAGLRGALRVASWIGCLCPAIILGMCLPWISWKDLKPLEGLFLGIAVSSLALSLVVVRGGGRPFSLLAILWIVNCGLCAMMIYLAFFFRLF